MVALDHVPRHLVVVGGSYIGLEFAQMFRRFGAEVTVVEKGRAWCRARTRILPTRSRTFSNAKVLRSGWTPNVSVSNRRRRHQGRPPLRSASRATWLAATCCWRVGRRPNTDDLGLDSAGIVQDKRGFISVDERLSTNIEGVFALGECNGRGAFTHTAYNDFEIVAANLLDGDDRKVSDRVPGYALYIDPPLGRAGMSEAEARGRRPLDPRRHKTDDACRARRRKRRDARLHEGRRPCRDRQDPRRSDPRAGRRRGDPRHTRCHQLGNALSRPQWPCRSIRQSRNSFRP